MTESDAMAESDDDPPIELNVSVDKIRDIVLLAREFDFAEIPDDPDPGEEPDAVADPETILDDGEDPTEAELREMIDDLNEDELIDLIALAWVGRGDFGRAEWADAKELARERQEKKASDYLLGLPTLSDYLEEGLATLGHAGVEDE
jgi:hypothetical protein